MKLISKYLYYYLPIYYYLIKYAIISEFIINTFVIIDLNEQFNGILIDIDISTFILVYKLLNLAFVTLSVEKAKTLLKNDKDSNLETLGKNKIKIFNLLMMLVS